MEMILYTAVAVLLYIVSDRLLLWLEARNGGLLPNRSLIFFGILLVLAMISFTVLRAVLGGP